MLQRVDLTDDLAVLVVDDDEFFRLAVSAVLRDRLDISTIKSCATATEAFARLEHGTGVDLALLDLHMPGVSDDRTLLDRVHQLCPNARMVVVSASKSRDDVLMALSAGANGYINKGLGIAELENALRTILSGAVYVPPFMAEHTARANVPALPGTPATEALHALHGLTPRQNEVLRLLIQGFSNKGIARKMDLSHGTVKFHLSAIFRALGAANRVEAAMIGARRMQQAGDATD